MKKNFIIPLLVSLIVSATTIGSWYYFTEPVKQVRIEHIDSTSSHALFTRNSDDEFVPLDFTQIAEQVVDAVVHIKSTQSFAGQNDQAYQYHQLPDPFRDFFDERSPFYEFFDPRNYKFESPQNPQSQPPMRMGTGSGVIINENGYIVTNNHVIANADEIEVTLHDNRSFNATVVGADPATDLALIQIKAEELPTLHMVNSDDVRVGEWVMAVGNPFSLNSTVTAGIVSAKGRNINILQDRFAVESFIQTDAAINPGNSGGALVNLQGGLIGINTAIASPTGAYSGYGFAVPANIVSKVVEDFLQYGKVQRAVLGVMIRPVTGNLQKERDLALSTGVLVDSLLDGSAAGAAGVRTGDIIVAIDQNEINTPAELQEIIATHRPRDEVDVKVNRDGKNRVIAVVLNNMSGRTELKEKEQVAVLNTLGLELEELAEAEKKDLNIKNGVKVTEIYPGTIRKYTQMQPGFVIVDVDGKSVDSIDDFVAEIESKSGGVMLGGVYKNSPGRYYYAFGMPENQ